MNRRWILTSALATTATVLALAPAWAADTPSAQAVKSMAAKTNGAGLQELSLDAVVEAVRQASVSAQVAGAIVSLSSKRVTGSSRDKSCCASTPVQHNKMWWAVRRSLRLLRPICV